MQTENVVNWCKEKICKLSKSLNDYCSVVLSIDDSYYSNFPIVIHDKNHPEIFCNLHLGRTQYRALDLVASDEDSCPTVLKNLIEGCLYKLEALQNVGTIQ